jgi:hypothetical protein
MRAKLDRQARASIIKRSKAYETGIAIREMVGSVTITDSTGMNHTPGGWIKLRYYKVSSARSQEEEFYVVEDAAHDVILGVTSPLCRESPKNPELFPLKSTPLSRGIYLPLPSPPQGSCNQKI